MLIANTLDKIISIIQNKINNGYKGKFRVSRIDQRWIVRYNNVG